MDGSATSGGSYSDYSDSTLSLLHSDPRKDHERTVDSILQYSLERYDQHGADIILKEVPYFHTPACSPNESQYRMSKEKGEMDVCLVNLDEEILRYIEVKSNPGDKEYADEQLERCAESFLNVGNVPEIDFDWEMIGSKVVSTNIDEEYAVPVDLRGTYYGSEEAIEKAENSEAFSELQEHIFDNRLRLDQEAMLDPLGNSDIEDVLDGVI